MWVQQQQEQEQHGRIAKATLSSSTHITDLDTEMKRHQMDSGCCGMSMLSDRRYFPYGVTDGSVVKVHTA